MNATREHNPEGIKGTPILTIVKPPGYNWRASIMRHEGEGLSLEEAVKNLLSKLEVDIAALLTKRQREHDELLNDVRKAEEDGGRKQA
jgi:hypothetical protein